MAFIYVFYYAFDFSRRKNNSGWLSLLSIGVLTIIISCLINRKYLEHDLSIKNTKVRWMRRCQIYVAIPLCIALLAHLQVFPLEIVFRNISASTEKVSFRIVAGMAFMSYMVFMTILRPRLPQNGCQG